MLRSFISVSLLSMSFALNAATAGGPLGEKANYQLDRAFARTSAAVTAGSGVASVSKYLPNHENGPHYTITLDYNVSINLYGDHKGSTSWDFPEEFFTPQFMEKLRKTGHYNTKDYKINYEGKADAKTLDGTTYKNCDKILIYDISVAGKSSWESMVAQAAGISADDIEYYGTSVENVKIRGHLYYPGVPVLAAVKLDLSATVDNVPVRAGFDYKRP